jgi:hypothetical protein
MKTAGLFTPAPPREIPPAIMARLCAEAEVSPNTIDRYLAGLPLRPSTRYRIERAVKLMEGAGE